MSLKKSFFQKRLNISLNYCPPISWLIHDTQKRVVNTPFYKEIQSLNLHTYDNLFMLRITFNLHRGAKGRVHNTNPKGIDETKKGRGLL